MRLSESVTAISNGHMGLRGSFEERYCGDCRPGFYLGGVWFPEEAPAGLRRNG